MDILLSNAITSKKNKICGDVDKARMFFRCEYLYFRPVLRFAVCCCLVLRHRSRPAGALRSHQCKFPCSVAGSNDIDSTVIAGVLRKYCNSSRFIWVVRCLVSNPFSINSAASTYSTVYSHNGLGLVITIFHPQQIMYCCRVHGEPIQIYACFGSNSRQNVYIQPAICFLWFQISFHFGLHEPGSELRFPSIVSSDDVERIQIIPSNQIHRYMLLQCCCAAFLSAWLSIRNACNTHVRMPCGNCGQRCSLTLILLRLGEYAGTLLFYHNQIEHPPYFCALLHTPYTVAMCLS